MNWLKRYQEGELTEVWGELLDQEGAVRTDPLRPEAWAVCDALMQRVGRNVEALIETLRAQGYVFAHEPLVPADAKTETFVQDFEAQVGPLPLALAAFYRHLGAVDFRGTHPAWDPPGPLHDDSPRNGLTQDAHCYADPLMVPALSALLRECVERSDELDELEANEGLMVTFSPDYLAKVEQGGGLYGILLPEACIDTDLEVDAPSSLVGYLRRAMAWGGFPGFAHYQRPPIADLEQLREPLVPF